MSSDPYTYVGAHARLEGGIALELRRPLHKYLTVIEVSREDAHRLLSGIAKVLFATASHDPRQADPSPVTDNDEIDAIVGALAALTDRVSALEEGKAPATPSAVTTDEGEAGDPGPRPRDGTAGIYDALWRVTTTDDMSARPLTVAELLARIEALEQRVANRGVEFPPSANRLYDNAICKLGGAGDD
jgi:hypothetical protein